MTTTSRPVLRGLFTVTIFLGAALLFLVQPLAGRLLLPLAGGTPALWNTCMVFFQVALLAGYLYAHLLTRLRFVRVQVIVHVALLAAAALVLPIGLAANDLPPGDASPVPWLLGALAGMAGLPFLVVATGAPLLQRWFAATDDPAAGDPYFLYAASNAGSLCGLLAYPLIVEPLLGLDAQRSAWSGVYLALAVLTIACGVAFVRRGVSGPGAVTAPSALPSERPGARTVLLWIALAFAPSSLMLGVTQEITTDIAAIPLFWIVPLAIYILTFVLAFAARPPVRPAFSGVVLLGLGPVVLLLLRVTTSLPVAFLMTLHFALLGVAGLACHGRLAALRPHPRHLTAYFLAIGAGGALGGVFNALVAPLVFDMILEYPIAIAAAVLLRDRSIVRAHARGLFRRLPLGLDVAVILIVLVYVPLADRPGGTMLDQRRTFFGVHRVLRDFDGKVVTYYHGTTLHGIQLAARPRDCVGYYGPETGLGHAYDRLAGDPRLDRVAVVGLGAGVLATRIEPGQSYVFFEIDPGVEAIASDPTLFTYLSDAAEPPRVVLGDGRLGLGLEPAGSFGMIVLDAFSSDSIPVHLLTLEAIDLYRDRLESGGLLMVNASNRYVDLRPLIAGLCARRDLVAFAMSGPRQGRRSLEEGRLSALWIAIAERDADLAAFTDDERWTRIEPDPGAVVWTDDFSSLLPLLGWW